MTGDLNGELGREGRLTDAWFTSEQGDRAIYESTRKKLIPPSELGWDRDGEGLIKRSKRADFACWLRLTSLTRRRIRVSGTVFMDRAPSTTFGALAGPFVELTVAFRADKNRR